MHSGLLSKHPQQFRAEANELQKCMLAEKRRAAPAVAKEQAPGGGSQEGPGGARGEANHAGKEARGPGCRADRRKRADQRTASRGCTQMYHARSRSTAERQPNRVLKHAIPGLCPFCLGSYCCDNVYN